MKLPTRTSHPRSPVRLGAVLATVLALLGAGVLAAPAAQAFPQYVLAVSHAPDRSEPRAIRSASFSAMGPSYVYVTPATGVVSVDFDVSWTALVDTGKQVHFHFTTTDDTAPFDMMGSESAADGQVPAAKPFDELSAYGADVVVVATLHLTRAHAELELRGGLSTTKWAVAIRQEPGKGARFTWAPVPGVDHYTFTGDYSSWPNNPYGYQVQLPPTATTAVDPRGDTAAGTQRYDTLQAWDVDGYLISSVNVYTNWWKTYQSEGTWMYSTRSDRSGARPLAGAVLTGQVYPFFVQAYSEPFKSYNFGLDTGPWRNEKARPFDLVGTAASGRAVPLDTRTLSSGLHTVRVGIGYERTWTTFTVAN